MVAACDIGGVGGKIVGFVDGIEPQPRDAFLVSLDGKTFSLGAISHRVFKANGGWWSMGQFSAGMPDAGSVDGVAPSGNHRMGHWSWQVHHFIVQVYPDPENDSALPDLVGRPLASRLLRATISTEPLPERALITWTISLRDGNDILSAIRVSYHPLMERRDRWGVALVGCFILGFIVAGLTATAVRLPNGAYDMQGMWMMAAAGFGAWVVSTAVVAALWLRAHHRNDVAPRER